MPTAAFTPNAAAKLSGQGLLSVPSEHEDGDIRSKVLRQVMQDFKIGVRELSRRTQSLEQERPGLQHIQSSQLSRYLGGHTDIYSKTLYTIELALPPVARQVYRAKLLIEETENGHSTSLIA